MFFKVKFITEFISAIKNAKNVTLKGIELLENGNKWKNGIFDILKFFFEIYEKLKKKNLKKLKKSQKINNRQHSACPKRFFALWPKDCQSALFWLNLTFSMTFKRSRSISFFVKMDSFIESRSSKTLGNEPSKLILKNLKISKKCYLKY